MSQDTLLSALWRQNRIFPVVIATLLVINLAFFLFLSLVQGPQSEKIEREYIELQAKTRQGKVVGGETPQARYLQAKSDLESFRAIIPPRSELSRLIAQLHELAAASGLSVQQIGYVPDEIPEENLLAYTLNFSVTGSYAEVKHFVFRLEQAQRLVIFDQFSLSAASSPDKPRQVSLNLKLTTYFLNNGAS